MEFSGIIDSFSEKRLPGSQVELSGSVPFDAVAGFREEALKNIAETMELPGFRKGFVPVDLALKKVGEMPVLEEAVELFIRDFYPALVEAKKLDVVSRPDIRITKLAPNNPVELTVRVSLYPEVELPKNWKELAKEVPEEKPDDITDEKVDQALESLRQSRKKEGEDAPALDDAFAQSVGAFADLADLKAKMREGLTEEAARIARDKRRGKIIGALLEKTKIDIPAVFVESELEKIIGQMKDDVTRYGLSFEDYLKRVEKTEDDLRAEFRDQAEKRAKLQLALNALADEAGVKADDAEVDAEMKHAIEHFPDAKEDLLRIHITTIIRNEKVLRMLEGSEKTEVKE